MKFLPFLLVCCIYLSGCLEKKFVVQDLDPVAPAEMEEPKKVKISAVQEPLESESAELTPLTEYFVQVGAFKEVKNALRLRQQIKDLGYSVTLRKKFIKEQKMILVEIGPFLDKEKALSFTDKARSRVELPRVVWVNKYLK